MKKKSSNKPNALGKSARSKISRQVKEALQEGINDGTVRKNGSRYILTEKGREEVERNLRKIEYAKISATTLQNGMGETIRDMCRLCGIQFSEWDLDEHLAEVINNTEKRAEMGTLIENYRRALNIAHGLEAVKYIDSDIVGFVDLLKI
jgi:DNA-binding PadR family transcriptional regulator